MRIMMIIGMCSLLMLSACTGLSTEQCRDIALQEADSWKEIGENQGWLDAMETCGAEREKLLRQFDPEPDEYIVVKGGFPITSMMIVSEKNDKDNYELLQEIWP